MFDLFRNWHNRLLSSPGFRQRAEKNIIGQWFARRYSVRMFGLFGGFIHTQVMLTCVKLGLFERLSSGPVSVAELADECKVEEGRLRHLLAAASSLDLLSRRRRDRYALGLLGASMLGNASVLAFVRHHEVFYRDLEHPLAFFRGETEPSLASLWSYATRDDALSDEEVSDYTALMAESQTMVAEQVLSAFSFQRCRSLVDVGGGSGAFARAVAARWPHLAITVADLPAVADIARSALRASGLERRIDVVGLDASTDAIPGSYDVASVVRIVHDHNDDKALEILKRARDALAPGGQLLLAEPIAADDAAGRLNDVYFQVYLLAMGSGRPRTRKELAGLLKKAGFSKVKRHRTPVPLITSVFSASN
ncbi:MAG: methyltransferase [Pseudomonadota bacterium]